MSFLRIGAVAGVAGVIAAWVWRRFTTETVDLHDVEARRQAAARWVGEGEIEEAEQMLLEAVHSLDGWPQAVAMGDLGTLLAACCRADDALNWFAKACQGPAVTESERLERVELRIRWAHLLTQAGDVSAAEEAIRAESGVDSYDELPGVLASEALAEMLIEQGRCSDALARLELVLPPLRSLQHDRAATCLVSLAYAATQQSRYDPWQELSTFPEDLQRAVVVNLADRSVQWDTSVWVTCIDGLIEAMAGAEAWDEARQQLRELQQELTSS